MPTLYETHRHMQIILENKRNLTEKEKKELKHIRLFLQQYENTRPKFKPVPVSTFKKNWRAFKMMFSDIFTNYNNYNNYD